MTIDRVFENAGVARDSISAFTGSTFSVRPMMRSETVSTVPVGPSSGGSFCPGFAFGGVRSCSGGSGISSDSSCTFAGTTSARRANASP